jgi:hypothetical protein
MGESQPREPWLLGLTFAAKERGFPFTSQHAASPTALAVLASRARRPPCNTA